MPQFIVTANRLDDGWVVFHGAGGWTSRLADATRLTEDAATARAQTLAGEPVIGIAVIEVDADGLPLRLRERIRVHGPTIRDDLAKSLEA
jgi:hypothetical protein